MLHRYDLTSTIYLNERSPARNSAVKVALLLPLDCVCGMCGSAGSIPISVICDSVFLSLVLSASLCLWQLLKA